MKKSKNVALHIANILALAVICSITVTKASALNTLSEEWYLLVLTSAVVFIVGVAVVVSLMNTIVS